MATEFFGSTASSIERAARVLKAAVSAWNERKRMPRTEKPVRIFVTVSRESGIDADPFCHRLAQLLNETTKDRWSVWDRELLEKVSTEQHIAMDILDKLEETPPTWLAEVLQAYSDTPGASELRIDKCVFTAIEALAMAGHAIIVGRGGMFVTEHLPGGIHVRLVAPLEHRIEQVAATRNKSPKLAAEHIIIAEKQQAKHYRTYWPKRSLGPEAFGLTLNAAALSENEMAE